MESVRLILIQILLGLVLTNLKGLRRFMLGSVSNRMSFGPRLFLSFLSSAFCARRC